MDPEPAGAGEGRRRDTDNAVDLAGRLLNHAEQAKQLSVTAADHDLVLRVREPRRQTQSRWQRWLTSEQVDQLAELYRLGASVPELVDRFGVSHTTVLGHLHRGGVETRHPRRKLCDEDVELAERYRQGETLKQIAADVDVHKETLRRELIKFRVVMRNGRFPR